MTVFSLNPYLIFGGQCGEAMEFYHEILGGELTMQKYSEAPMPCPPGSENKIIHALLKTPELTIMGSDDNTESPVKLGNNVQMSLVGTNEPRLTEIFTKLSDGGSVYTPLQKMFWGDMFGMLVDKYGVSWMVNIGSNAKQ